MLLDANVLIYATNDSAGQHKAAAAWLDAALTGARKVALPWQSLNAFLRISTLPRVFQRPLTAAEAWGQVYDWLSVGVTWIPEPDREYSRIYGELITSYGVTGNLVPDAALAALAIEHGVPLISTDTDFARFRELRWENPLA